MTAWRPCCLLLMSLAAVGASAESKPISVASSVAEMTDPAASSTAPSPFYRLNQASSHDWHKRDPWDAETWHSNADAGNFLRAELHQGRREWVVMEDTGPGAIVRWWVPARAEEKDLIVRFDFDGAETPSFEYNYIDLLSGRGPVKPPFAHWTHEQDDVRAQLVADSPPKYDYAADFYFPIPYAKGCKVTFSKLPFYYILDYRSYVPSARVKTFSVDQITPAVAALGDKLLAQMAPKTHDLVSQPLAPGATTEVDLPAGERAVTQVEVKFDPAQAPQCLRSLVLEATFDDEATVWCPLSEFFDTGCVLSDVRDVYRHVDAKGHLSASFVMPYHSAAKLTLRNVGLEPYTAGLSAQTAPRRWTTESYHFHASWHSVHAMPTRPMSDWNYVAIRGEGRYIGDTLTVHTDDPQWYGEGDERIYLEDETFPAHIGTGTEDYYGQAWGMVNFLSTPFLSNPHRSVYSRGDWHGYTTTTRLRRLDAIAFDRGLKVDMEIWHWSDTRVDYAVATFWYGKPGATCNIVPQLEEAAMILPPPPPDPASYKIDGAIELEDLAVAAQSPDLPISQQHGSMTQGAWSKGGQLFIQATKIGQFIELDIPAPGTKPVDVTLYATQAIDYGALRFAINGERARVVGTGSDIWDGYNDTARVSGPLPLGRFTPQNGKLRLRVELAGVNPKAKDGKGYFGLDAVVLKEAE